MQLDKLFVNAVVVNSDGRFEGCVGVKDGVIAVMAKTAEGLEAAETIDVAGKYLLPGAIDGHVHFNDFPKGIIRTNVFRDDIDHASMAAAAGGITTILSHPMNEPCATNVANYQENLDQFAGRSYVDYGLHGGAAAGNIDEMEDLWTKTGATAVKMFMSYYGEDFANVNDYSMYKHMQTLARVGGAVLVHAENDDLVKQLQEEKIKEGKSDYLAFNATHPEFEELEAIERTIFFAEQTGATAMVCHISSAKGIQMIHDAQQRGVKIHAETSPQYLTFVLDDMAKLGTYLKFTPPMHDADNKEAIWELLDKGYVDCIGSDHSPWSKEEKDVPADNIWKAPNGIPGLEMVVPVLLDGAAKGKVSLERVVEVTSYNPAKYYGIYPKKGAIAVGFDADFYLADLDANKHYTDADIKSGCPWSPYVGRTFKGWPVMTIVRGEVICKDGKILGKKGYGQYIARPK